MRNLLTDMCGLERGLQQFLATPRPDHLWREIWSSMSKAAQRMEKQRWAIEKPKLDNARKLRGIYLVDPDDGEFKETMKNARKKLEVPIAAILCKLMTFRGLSNEIRKSKRCIGEAHESASVWKELHPKCHEDHIAVEFNSLSHILVHKTPTFQAMKIPARQQWTESGRT